MINGLATIFKFNTLTGYLLQGEKETPEPEFPPKGDGPGARRIDIAGLSEDNILTSQGDQRQPFSWQ